jgi:hypothetical protein
LAALPLIGFGLGAVARCHDLRGNAGPSGRRRRSTFARTTANTFAAAGADGTAETTADTVRTMVRLEAVPSDLDSL